MSWLWVKDGYRIISIWRPLFCPQDQWPVSQTDSLPSGWRENVKRWLLLIRKWGWALEINYCTRVAGSLLLGGMWVYYLRRLVISWQCCWHGMGISIDWSRSPRSPANGKCERLWLIPHDFMFTGINWWRWTSCLSCHPSPQNHRFFSMDLWTESRGSAFWFGLLWWRWCQSSFSPKELNCGGIKLVTCTVHNTSGFREGSRFSSISSLEEECTIVRGWCLLSGWRPLNWTKSFHHVAVVVGQR